MHLLVLEDDMTDQEIAREREDDDEGVSHRGVLGPAP